MKSRPLAILLVVFMGALGALLVPDRGTAVGLDHFIITGAGPGGGPHVRVFNGDGTPTSTGFFAYGETFTGGVHVAAGNIDLNGDDEIVTGAGPGGGAHVRAFTLSGDPTDLSFFAYDPGFTGGVFVAHGEVTLEQHRVSLIATGAGPGGGPHVKLFAIDPQTLAVEEFMGFFPYSPAFGGGVRVAMADLDADGSDELITGAGPGGGPHVRAFDITDDGLAEIGNFNAYGATFPGGVFVAGASHAQQVVTGPGAGGGPDVRTFKPDGSNLLASFQAYASSFTGGVHVAAGDLNDDDIDEIVTGAGPGGGPHVRAFNLSGSATPVSFFAYNPAFPGGVFVAVAKAVPPPTTSTSSTTALSSTTSTTGAGSTTTTTSCATPPICLPGG